MAALLKQSTTVTIRLGPALDKTDGVTEETGLSPTVEVSKGNGAFAARNSATAITHDSNGWYAVELNTTDTGTLGPLIAKFDDSTTHLPVWREFLVVPANVYDSIVGGTDTLQADVTQWNGTNVASPATAGYPAVTLKVGTGTGEVNLSSGKAPATIAAGDIAASAITASAIATGAIDADALAADAVDEILDEVVEGTLTMRQVLRLLIAFATGKATGGASTTVTFRDSGDSKNRIVMTVDSDGNRSAVTTDVS